MKATPRRRVILLPTLCLALIAATTGAGEKKQAITRQQAELFNSAAEMLERGEYAKAIDLLRNEVDASEEPHPYACIIYGVSHLRLDNNAKAIEVFAKGLAAAPNDSALLLNLAGALAREERYEEAGDAFFTAAGLDAGNSDQHRYTAAQCYYFAENYERSLGIVKLLLDSPEVKPSWATLAAVNAVQLSRWGEAERYVERARDLEPDEVSHWKNLAYVRMQQKKLNQAVAAFDISTRYPGAAEEEHKQLSAMYRQIMTPILGLEVEKLLPVDHERQRIHVHSLLKGNRLAQLIEYMDESLGDTPSTEFYLIKGVACYRLGLLEEAERAFGNGAELDGEERERCRMLEGLTAWERRDWHSAKAAFRILTDTDDGHYQFQAMTAIVSIEAMEAIEREIVELDGMTE